MTSPALRFSSYWRSSAAWRCRIAFNLKGIEPQMDYVHLLRDGGQHHDPAYRARNPQALVPTLEVDGAPVTQSLAIIEWIDETWPDPPLLPSHPLLRAKVRAFALSIACEIHPLQNLRVQRYLRDKLQLSDGDVAEWLKHWISTGLVACEQLLSDEACGNLWAFGDSPGLADIVLAPQLYAAERFGVDIADLPRIALLADTYDSTPAFLAARPELQADADP